MADKTENMISPPQKDTDFLLAEISFFAEGFFKNKNDKIALIIAQSINKYLKCNGAVSEINQILSELEAYIPDTQSDDFVWELVYIRRFISSSRGCSENVMLFSADQRHHSATYFETICKLTPTVYNQCCRVQEYLFVIVDLIESKRTETEIIARIEELIKYSKSLFSEIEKNNKQIYFETGKLLYLVESIHFDDIKATDDKSFDARKNLVYYMRELYKIDSTQRNLSLLVAYYIEYMHNKNYSYEEEKTNLTELIELAEKSFCEGDELIKDDLDKLKHFLAIHESASS